MENTKVKGCANCLYLATHEKCDGCLVDKGNSLYEYNNYIEGDGIARIKQFEQDGKRSIVIGGSGEAEVNVLDTPEKTFGNLCNVAEQCGYLTTKGAWYDHHKEIFIITEGQYKLTYFNNKLDTIDRIITQRQWNKK